MLILSLHILLACFPLAFPTCYSSLHILLAWFPLHFLLAIQSVTEHSLSMLLAFPTCYSKPPQLLQNHYHSLHCCQAKQGLMSKPVRIRICIHWLKNLFLCQIHLDNFMHLQCLTGNLGNYIHMST